MITQALNSLWPLVKSLVVYYDGLTRKVFSSAQAPLLNVAMFHVAISVSCNMAAESTF